MSDTFHFVTSEISASRSDSLLNASRFILEGMKRQCGINDFHFLVTLRSFIEYTRRGICLGPASDKQLHAAETLTFDRSGSPGLARMDKMINKALGLGEVCYLLNTVKGVNEPYSQLSARPYSRQSSLCSYGRNWPRQNL